MKKMLLLLMVLLGSRYLYSQIAKVQFTDTTIGYAFGINEGLGVGDTIVLEYIDQNIWKSVKDSSTESIIKTGIIQKVVFYSDEFDDTYANFYFADDDRKKPRIESVDDWMVLLLTVGDSVQMISSINDYNDEVYKLYLSHLSTVGTVETKLQTVVITRIKL
jgi:hypothetical protein